jgi:hypothetical protein
VGKSAEASGSIYRQSQERVSLCNPSHYMACMHKDFYLLLLRWYQHKISWRTCFNQRESFIETTMQHQRESRGKKKGWKQRWIMCLIEQRARHKQVVAVTGRLPGTLQQSLVLPSSDKSSKQYTNPSIDGRQLFIVSKHIPFNVLRLSSDMGPSRARIIRCNQQRALLKKTFLRKLIVTFYGPWFQLFANTVPDRSPRLSGTWRRVV